MAISNNKNRTLLDDLRDFRAGRIADKYNKNYQYKYEERIIGQNPIDPYILKEMGTLKYDKKLDLTKSLNVDVNSKQVKRLLNPADSFKLIKETDFSNNEKVELLKPVDGWLSNNLYSAEELDKNQKQKEYDDYINRVEKEESIQQYAEKYKNSKLEQRKNAMIHSSDPLELDWLNNHLYENSSSEELKLEQEKLRDNFSNYNQEYNRVVDEASSINKKQGFDYDGELKKMETERNNFSAKINELDGLIERRIQEENADKYYNDIISDNAKAGTIVQQYYNVVNGITSNNNVADSYSEMQGIVENDEERKNRISAEFEKLKEQGIDADKMLKYYSRIHEREERAKFLDRVAGNSKKDPVFSSLGSVVDNTVGSVWDAGRYVGAWADKTFLGGDGYIDPNSTNVKKARVVREAVSEDMNGFGKFLYQTGMSMADFTAMLPMNLFPGGQAASLAILSSSAGVDSANTVLENGGTLDKAILSGIASGTAEAFFERFSLEQLKAFKQSGGSEVKDLVLNVLKGSFTEGSEEVATEISNAITDQIINGDMSSLSLQYQNYIDSGMTEDEANKQIAIDFGSQVGLSFAGGALSGGVLNIGVGGINYINNKVNENKATSAVGSLLNGQGADENTSADELITLGKDLDSTSKAHKLATKIETDTAKGNKVSDKKMGKLFNAVMRDTSTYTERTYKQETKNLNKQETAVVDKIIKGKSLDKAEVKISQNDNVASAVKSIIKSRSKAHSTQKSAVDTVNNAIRKTMGVISDDNTSDIDVKVSKSHGFVINDKPYSGVLNIVDTDPKARTVVYETENGDIVTSDNIEFPTHEEGAINYLASRYNANTAQKFVNDYKQGQNIEKYAREWNLYQNYGRLVVPLTQENMNNRTILTDEQMYSAYDSGIESYKSHYQTQKILAQKAKQSSNYSFKHGSFDDSAVRNLHLNKEQRSTLKGIKAFAELTGLNIEMFASKSDNNGDYIGEQGSWNAETKTLRLDINSGKRSVNNANINHAITNTMAHELTHTAAEGKYFGELRDTLAKIINDSEIAEATFKDLVDNQLNNIEKNNKYKSLTEDEKLNLAEEEAVAEACEIMLKNTSIFDTLISENKNLAQRILDSLKAFIKHLQEFINKNTSALTYEGSILEQALNASKEAYAKLQDVWDKAVISGVKTINAKIEQKNNTADNSNVKNSSRYSYDKLINKPDMKITVIDDRIEYTPNASTRKSIVDDAVKNAAKVGYINTNGNVAVNVKDIDTDIIISKKALRHGIDRRLNVLAPITLNVGEILHNSIKINEMTPKNSSVDKSYILIGTAKNKVNEPYIVTFVVNRSTNELTSVDVLYSINTKTEPVGSLSPDVPTKVDYLTGSKISISNLLDYVNKYYADILPEDVLKYYNYDTRPEGKLGKSVLYQFGGRKAEGADVSLLDKAERMEKEGSDSETIRQETGWFRGYDGKWRFEIDDSKMTFIGLSESDIDRIAQTEIFKNRMNELEKKVVNDTATKSEENEYYELDDQLMKLQHSGTLDDYITHPTLFKAYPQLKSVKVNFAFDILENAHYISSTNTITLNARLRNAELKNKLVHEIQHAIQNIENFARGSNIEYWENRDSDNPYGDYYNTAGEIEARDVEKRIDYNAEQRKNIRPDIDNNDVVFANNANDAEYSIRYTEDNQPVVVIKDNILYGVRKKDWVKTVKKAMTEKFKDGIPIKGKLIKVNKITRDEYTNSKYSKYLRDNNGTVYADKFKSTDNLDEIIIASTNYVNEDLKHIRKDNFKEFARGNVLLKIGDNDYSANVVVGFTEQSQMVLYDIINFNPANLKLKKESTPDGHQKESIRSGMLSNNTVSYKNDSVNNYSTQEDENNDDKVFQPYNFNKALSKEEWASFYSSLQKDNQRNAFRISDNGILIPDKNTSENYKLVCYEGNNTNLNVTAVYKLENYDYNIHSSQSDASKLILELERNGYNDKQTRTILRDYASLYQTVFKRYNNKSGRFVKLTRESVSNRENVGVESDRTGAFEDAGQGVSNGRLDEDIKFQQRSDGGFSNRELLSNALDDVVQNGEEKSVLKAYKEGISQINELEERLKTVNSQIKNISFTKGSDRSQLPKLKEQQKQLRQRIDRKDSLLLKIEAMKPMQSLIASAKTKAIQKYRAKANEQIAKIREIKNAKIAKEIKHRQEAVQKIRDSRDRNAYIVSIKKLHKEFVQMINHPTDTKYVPEEFKTELANITASITDALVNNENSEASQALLELSSQLRKVGDSGYSILDGEFDNDFVKHIEHLSEIIKGQKINKDISVENIKEIYETMRSIRSIIRDANKFISRNDNMTIAESATKIIDEINSADGDKGFMTNYLNYMLSPVRIVRKIVNYKKDSELVKAIQVLEKGETKKTNFEMHETKSIDELKEKYSKEYKRSVSEVISIEYMQNNGKRASVDITRNMGMTIIMSWKREMLNNKLRHMEELGVNLPEAKTYAKQKYSKSHDNSITISGINQSFINAISEKMTTFEKNVIDVAENYFNHSAKNVINEVSLAIKKRAVATDEYYIPFDVDGDYIPSNFETLKFDARIQNMGKLKSVVNNDSKPIIIHGIFELLAKDINLTSRLYGLAVPLRDFNKLLNYRQSVLTQNADGSEKITFGKKTLGVIKDKWGDKTVKMFESIVTDLNFERRTQDQNPVTNAMYWLRTQNIKSIFSFNPKIAIEQYSAYYGAQLYVSEKAMLYGIQKSGWIATHWQTVINEIDSYTPLHWQRRKGMSTKEMLEFQSSKLSKLPKIINPSKWIQLTDCHTTAMQWYACKKEIKLKYNTKNMSTQEYFGKVTELYEKIINNTQQVYDVLHTSEAIKNKNAIWQNIFMFKTEPMQNTGFLYDSAMEYLTTKNKKAKDKFVRASYVTLKKGIVYQILKATMMLLLFKAYPYDDDETGEVNIGTIAKGLSWNLVNDMAELLLPLGGSNAMDLIEKNLSKTNSYYENSSIIEDVVSLLTNIPNDIISEVKDVFYQISIGQEIDMSEILKSLRETFVSGFSLTGVPVQNIIDAATALYKWVGVANGNPYSSAKPTGNSMSKKYGAMVLRGDTENANNVLTQFYQMMIDKHNSIKQKKPEKYKNTSPENEARRDVRDALAKAYKKEYQEEWLRNVETTPRMQEIVDILRSSGYMRYDNKTLPKLLSEWRKNAKNDLITN